MSKINRYPFNNREEFLAIRNKLHAEHRLGGSDIGTAAGENKYKCARRFYEEMTGHIAAPDISNKQAVKDGIICEDIVAQKFTERTGKAVHRVNAVMTNTDFPHLFASIDRKVEGENAGLECKTANALNEDAFKGGKLPKSYIRQVLTYMAVTGFRRWYLHAWVMGKAEYTYLFTMDSMDNFPYDGVYLVTDEMLQDNERIAAGFLDAIETENPPPMREGDDDAAILKELYPNAEMDEAIALQDIGESDIAMMDTYKEQIKQLEDLIETIENRIKAEMGEHSTATVGSYSITWKNNKSGTKTDWKSVAKAANATDELIQAHTKVTPGARVLRISIK